MYSKCLDRVWLHVFANGSSINNAKQAPNIIYLLKNKIAIENTKIINSQQLSNGCNGYNGTCIGFNGKCNVSTGNLLLYGKLFWHLIIEKIV